MKAVIIMHSEGNRLRPITCTTPKAMLPIVGRPLIEHTLRLLHRHNFKKVIISTDYLSAEISEHLSSLSLGEMNTVLVPLGPVESFLDKEDTLFISGSVLTDTNLDALIDHHKKLSAEAVLITGTNMGGYEYGAVNCSNTGIISSYTRFPDFLHPTGYAFSGIALVCGGTAIDGCSTIASIPEKIVENKIPACVYSSDCYIRDISDFDSYHRAVRDFMDKKVNLPFPCDEKVPGVWIDENANVMQGAVIVPPVYIGRNTLISRGARIEAYSQIGNNSTVDCFAGVKRSIIMDNSYVRENAAVRGAIIGKKAEIGRDSCVYEGSIISDGVKIGGRCTLRTAVQIWPDKYIEDGSCVSENIVWEKTCARSLFSDGSALGVINRELTPEFAATLARSVVQLLGEKIAVSCDGGGSASMLKSALISGIASGGGVAYDFGEQPLPITRSGIRFYNLHGGLALSTYTSNNIMYGSIDIINSLGADVEAEQLEKTEKLVSTATAKRHPAPLIAEPEFMFEYKLYYLKQLINSTSKKPLGARVLLHCPSPWAQELLKSACADLDSEFVFTDTQDKDIFSKEVKEGAFDMGIICDYKCESITPITAGGRILSEYDYSALCSLIVMKLFPGVALHIPMSSPESIEALAKKYDAHINRSKISPPHLMNELSKSDRKSFLTQFIYRFDAVGAIILLLDYLYTNGETLDTLLQEIPASNIVTTCIDCSVKEQGEVLHKLQKKHRAEFREDSDALKISFDKGWVLIVPKKNDASINLIGYGDCVEYAKEIADICLDEILDNK